MLSSVVLSFAGASSYVVPMRSARSAVRMQVETGGAAVMVKEVDIWAGNSPLIMDCKCV